MTENSVFLKSWNNVTIIPSLLFLDSRFCTSPEVNFHIFGTSKHGKEKSLSNIFFAIDIIISTLWRFYRVNKNLLHFKSDEFDWKKN